MVTVADVRALTRTLPRTSEHLIRDRVKFRVGAIVYVAFSRDETTMGSATRRRNEPRWSPPSRSCSSCPARRTCASTGSAATSTGSTTTG
ncbi:hypothetical protein [Micromonospora sp. PLK6-60]|uniref:hypothetical protein n=1 Tax=Micromonospora sp. PLK6-60 TaxID=2873383 RepID=UPI0021029680|nr:hypothetical protein [Micromonospora sp. PLK6-60]